MSPEAEPPVLVDRLPPHLRASRTFVLLVGALGAWFWWLCSRPVWHTDVWGHLKYGEWIWQHRGLPAFEPLMPLAQGMPMVDTAWLAQLAGFGVYSAWGVAGVQFLFALCVTAGFTALAVRLWRGTGSLRFVLLGLAACGLLLWSQLFVGIAGLVRPQVMGWMCFTVLFARLSGARLYRFDWFLIPALFAVWGNVHGSFVLGLLVFAAFAVGRGWDVVRQTGTVRSVWHDRRLRELVLVGELSAAAVLLNPFGLGLYAEILAFSRNRNLADLVEWMPLEMRGFQAQGFLLVACLLAMVYRNSPRRVRHVEPLLLFGFGLWTCWTSRMIGWWAVPAAYYFAVHAHAAWAKRRQSIAEPEARRGLYSAVAVGLVWIAFAATPFGSQVIHGKPGALKDNVSSQTPLGAVAYLREHPPQGLVFHTYEWGDYLRWAGPEGMQIFVNSHVHLIPRDVWENYLAIIYANSTWKDLLDRYSVTTVVVDKPHDALIARLRDEGETWKPVYEDGQAMIFTRASWTTGKSEGH